MYIGSFVLYSSAMNGGWKVSAVKNDQWSPRYLYPSECLIAKGIDFTSLENQE